MKIITYRVGKDTRLEFKGGGLLHGFDHDHVEKIKEESPDAWIRILTLCKHVEADSYAITTHILGHPDGRLAVVNDWEMCALEVEDDGGVDDYTYIRQEKVIEAAFQILEELDRLDSDIIEARKKGESWEYLAQQHFGLSYAIASLENTTKIPLKYLWHVKKYPEFR